MITQKNLPGDNDQENNVTSDKPETEESVSVTPAGENGTQEVEDGVDVNETPAQETTPPTLLSGMTDDPDKLDGLVQDMVGPFPFKTVYSIAKVFLTSYFSGRRKFSAVRRGDAVNIETKDTAYNITVGAFSVILALVNAVDALPIDEKVLANGYTLDKYDVPSWVNQLISYSAIRLGAGRKWIDFQSKTWIDHPWEISESATEFILESKMMNGVPTPSQVTAAIDEIYKMTKLGKCTQKTILAHSELTLSDSSFLLRAAIVRDGLWYVDLSDLDNIPLFLKINFMRPTAKSDEFNEDAFETLLHNFFDKVWNDHGGMVKPEAAKENK